MPSYRLLYLAKRGKEECLLKSFYVHGVCASKELQQCALNNCLATEFMTISKFIPQFDMKIKQEHNLFLLSKFRLLASPHVLSLFEFLFIYFYDLIFKQFKPISLFIHAISYLPPEGIHFSNFNPRFQLQPKHP